MPELILDSFASWLCSQRITWTLAEAGFMSARMQPLCIARAFGVPVRWHHLTGRVGIMDARPGDGARASSQESGHA